MDLRHDVSWLSEEVTGFSRSTAPCI